MVSGMHKSRRLRRVKVRTSKGPKMHYERRNRGSSKCAITKKPLRGLPRLTDAKYGRLNKSQKTVSRPYGGYMGHDALKKKILEEMVLKGN